MASGAFSKFISNNDEGAKYVAEALKVNTSLTKINLSYNNIGDEGKQALREVWNHNDGLIL